MIQIDITTALAIYSGVICMGALCIWLYTETATYRRHHALEKQNLWNCAYCRYVYLDELAATVSQCPRCKSFNSVDDKLARYITAPKRKEEPQTVPETPEQRRNPARGKRPGSSSRGPRRRR